MSQAADISANPVAAPVPTVPLRPNEFNLIWVDMEMTGLNPDSDRIIEVAVVVTDPQLNILAEGPVFAIHQADEIMDGMDAWNKGTHGRSGLIERVKTSTVTENEAIHLIPDPLGISLCRPMEPESQRVSSTRMVSIQTCGATT